MSDNNNDNEPPNILLELVLNQVRELARQGGYNEADAVQPEKIRIVLEASSGDIDLAVNLYWDDFLVTHTAQQRQQRQPPQQRPRLQRAEDDDDDDDSHEALGEDDPPPPPQRRIPEVEQGEPIRRRLEDDFIRHANDDANNANNNNNRNNRNNNQQEVNDDYDAGGVARILARARETVRRLGRQQVAAAAADNDDGDAQNDVRAIAVRAAEAFLAAANDEQAESVSVSDDESGRWRMVGGRAVKMKDEDSCPEESSEPKRKRQKLSKADEQEEKAGQDGDDDDDDDDEDEGYLSDSDWLWESLTSRSSIPLRPPTDLLWGLPASTTSGTTAPAGEEGEAGNGSNHVIADDDGDDERNNERSGIPRTWLSAGFHLSECGHGLVLKPPSEDDLAYFSWQQRVSGRNTPRNAPPPPYHCRAISALVSIVTALLYTGASIQGRDVTCTSSRKPFSQLDEHERKREFEARLADALSALLLIAVKSSLERKQRALKKLKSQMSIDPAEKRKWQKLERRLHVCPTCSWRRDPNTGETHGPEGRESDRTIQIATSYTNIQDLREYILANMRSFTSSGGCALFLETILRIHGKGAVNRMIRRSRQQAQLSNLDKALIDCTCEERYKKELDANPAMRTSRNKNVDTTPLGHECISIELVSLLLTGKVYSTLQGWTSGPLEVGMLSDKAGEVGKGLSRPDSPSWILRGPTLYSVLWLNESQDSNAESFSKIDQPGAVALLTHWNCWYGQRNRTELRLVADRSKWIAPTFSKGPFLEDEPSSSDAELPKTLTLLNERQRSRLLATEARRGTEPVDPELVFSKEEIERVVVNQEDETFYPGKYQLWRYDFDENPDENEEGKKQRIPKWKPYHRLSSREKLLVETKLGPKIKTILWTRWPRATVDRFTPEGTPPVV